jgi:hypothetical protein
LHLSLEPWQAQKATGLGKNVTEFNETTAFPDDVEQVAVFTGRRIGLMCS